MKKDDKVQYLFIFAVLVVGVYFISRALNPENTKQLNDQMVRLANNLKGQIPAVPIASKNAADIDVDGTYRNFVSKTEVVDQKRGEDFKKLGEIFGSSLQESKSLLVKLDKDQKILENALLDYKSASSQFLLLLSENSAADISLKYTDFKKQVNGLFEPLKIDIPKLDGRLSVLTGQLDQVILNKKLLDSADCTDQISCSKKVFENFEQNIRTYDLDILIKKSAIVKVWGEMWETLNHEFELLKNNTKATEQALLSMSEQVNNDINLIKAKHPGGVLNRLNGWLTQEEDYWSNLRLNQERFLQNSKVFWDGTDLMADAVDEKLMGETGKLLKQHIQNKIISEQLIADLALQDNIQNQALDEMMASAWSFFGTVYRPQGTASDIVTDWADRQHAFNQRILGVAVDTSEIKSRLIRILNDLGNLKEVEQEPKGI
ncbi:MAG: hypothetical protein HQL26_08845 [Candidatus Omnitrophica bacterium]|nr:hypothetical protein [Candidatus Omnitrophota bacterium]